MRKQAILLSLTFVLVCIFAISAVNASIGPSTNVYVDPNGNDSNTGTLLSPYKTINWGIENVAENGSVHLAAGTYSQYYPKDVDHRDYGIFINKNVTIIGSGEDQTIIDAQGKNKVFIINTDKTVTIKSLTIKNGLAGNVDGEPIGAIENYGILNLENTKFDSNQGGAIYNTGTMQVERSTFTKNTVIAIYNAGTMRVENSTFTKNTGESGSAICADHGNNLIKGCTFSENIDEIGGALHVGATDTYVEIADNKFINNKRGMFIFLPVKNVQITGNQFLGNEVGILIYYETMWDGYFDPSYNNVHINFNRFVGNKNYGIQYDNKLNHYIVDATLNWWGSNLEPNKPNSDKTYGNVTWSPWLTLNLYLNKALYTGQVATINADLFTDSFGNSHIAQSSQYPSKIPITFTTTRGTIGSHVKLTDMVYGFASIPIFNNEGAGPTDLSAILDGETKTLNTVTLQTPTANAASDTVGMQKTGIPVAGLILAILMLAGGLITARK